MVFIVKPHIANGFLPVRSVVFFFFFGHEREKTNSIERERDRHYMRAGREMWEVKAACE